MSTIEQDRFTDSFMGWWEDLSPEGQLQTALDADLHRGVKEEIGFDMRESFDDVHEMNRKAKRQAYMSELDQLLSM